MFFKEDGRGQFVGVEAGDEVVEGGLCPASFSVMQPSTMERFFWRVTTSGASRPLARHDLWRVTTSLASATLAQVSLLTMSRRLSLDPQSVLLMILLEHQKSYLFVLQVIFKS